MAKGKCLTDFAYPWDSAQAPALFCSTMGWKWLYGSLPVKDDSVITLVKKNDKMEVGASDRVEIFLKKMIRWTRIIAGAGCRWKGLGLQCCLLPENELSLVMA